MGARRLSVPSRPAVPAARQERPVSALVLQKRVDTKSDSGTALTICGTVSREWEEDCCSVAST